jgi:hypothetical protein
MTVDIKPLASHCCGFKSQQRLLYLSCEEAWGTSVVLLGSICTRKGTWGLYPPVKLKNRHMTYTVLVQGKTQPTIHFNMHMGSVLNSMFQRYSLPDMIWFICIISDVILPVSVPSLQYMWSLNIHKFLFLEKSGWQC